VYRLADSRGRRQAWIIGPLALVAAVPLIDHFVPPTMHFFPVLALAPAVTATFASARRVALVGALAAVALVIAGMERSVLTTETVLVQMFSLVLLTGALVFFRHLRDRREGELVRVRLVSEAAQSVVLRPLPERAGPVSVASTYHAAEADAHIGGDFYALARTADSTRLIIGDVRGSGLAAISETAVLMESFRAASRQQLPLAELVSYLDGSVRWGLAQFARAEADLGERFATLAVADIPDREPVVRLILCGHPPPLLLRQGTATPLTVPQPAPPLGLGTLAGVSYAPQVFGYAPGDVLLLHTDGVTEARNARGVFYPLAQRCAAWAGCPPAELIRNIESDLRAHAPGPSADDMAMIAVQRDAELPVGGDQVGDPPGAGQDGERRVDAAVGDVQRGVRDADPAPVPDPAPGVGDRRRRVRPHPARARLVLAGARAGGQPPGRPGHAPGAAGRQPPPGLVGQQLRGPQVVGVQAG
jgi:serine phosphatase RsbU (regulator of sigma subunit)